MMVYTRGLPPAMAQHVSALPPCGVRFTVMVPLWGMPMCIPSAAMLCQRQDQFDM